MKILVIDDNRDNLVSVTAMLRNYLPGCETETAESGTDGIGKARSFLPDTILLDIRMPGLDGYQVCRIIKSDSDLRHIPIIYLTAVDSDPASKIKGLESGGEAFLTKPVDPGELMAQVRAMVRIKQAEDRLRDENRRLEKAIHERTAALRESEESYRRINSRLESMVRDRTERLEASVKELEAFSYSVSHDLRAPLRILTGFSEALQTRYGTVLDEEGRHFIERICEASHRMGELIQDLLDLSLLTRRDLVRVPVDMSALAASVAENMSGQSPDKSVEFRIEEGMRAVGDSHLLRIVFENLIGNARKFSEKGEGPRIEVGTEHEGAETWYYVRDNGVGFNMEFAGKLFAPFQRLHNSKDFPGTGIGLATVQRIILRHGGRIKAESRQGEGATFSFTLGNAVCDAVPEPARSPLA